MGKNGKRLSRRKLLQLWYVPNIARVARARRARGKEGL